MTPTLVLAGAAALGAAGVIAADIAARQLGFIDFPTYVADSELGYIPRPNQRGRLRSSPRRPRAPWAFNELSMGVAEKFEPKPGSILLLGDSIVFTSATTPQPNKLGPLLQKRLDKPVWPVGAGSWGLTNELAYLQRNPQVLACETLVVIVNTGDFQDRSVWSDPIRHPLHRPLWATLYLLRKMRHRPFLPPFEFPSPAQEGEWGGLLDWLFATYKGRVVFVLYADKDDVKGGPDKFEAIRRRLAGRAEIFETLPHWKIEYYRDNMHPTDAAYPILADLIATQLERRRAA